MLSKTSSGVNSKNQSEKVKWDQNYQPNVTILVLTNNCFHVRRVEEMRRELKLRISLDNFEEKIRNKCRRILLSPCQMKAWFKQKLSKDCRAGSILLSTSICLMQKWMKTPRNLEYAIRQLFYICLKGRIFSCFFILEYCMSGERQNMYCLPALSGASAYACGRYSKPAFLPWKVSARGGARNVLTMLQKNCTET